MNDRKRIPATAALLMVCLSVVITATETFASSDSAPEQKPANLQAIARRDRSRQRDSHEPMAVPRKSDLAESTRSDLSRSSGAVLAKDHRRETIFATPDPVSGRDRNAADQITPADCLARVRLLSAEIEEIRRIMGKPKTNVHGIRIEGAQPRDVLYQAQTLYRKANRLAFENTSTSHDAPVTASKPIRPIHVWKIADASLRRVLHVKKRFGIVAEFTEVKMPESTVPSDVFLAILKTNRQLNSLLTKDFAPANVFQQVTVAVHYASRLLEQFDQSVATIEEPEFQEAIVPAQVHERLLSCFETLRRIGSASGIEVLSLTLPVGGVSDISPSDVYDVASLIVAELAYLHSRIPDADPPERAYFPGVKFPSHVLQRAELLRRQLEALERLGRTKHD